MPLRLPPPECPDDHSGPAPRWAILAEAPHLSEPHFLIVKLLTWGMKCNSLCDHHWVPNLCSAPPCMTPFNPSHRPCHPRFAIRFSGEPAEAERSLRPCRGVRQAQGGAGFPAGCKSLPPSRPVSKSPKQGGNQHPRSPWLVEEANAVTAVQRPPNPWGWVAGRVFSLPEICTCSVGLSVCTVQTCGHLSTCLQAGTGVRAALPTHEAHRKMHFPHGDPGAPQIMTLVLCGSLLRRGWY